MELENLGKESAQKISDEDEDRLEKEIFEYEKHCSENKSNLVDNGDISVINKDEENKADIHESSYEDVVKKRLIYSAVESEASIVKKSSRNKNVADLKKSLITDSSVKMTGKRKSVNVSCLIDYNKEIGDIFLFGEGDAGQFGMGVDDIQLSIPRLLKDERKFIQVCCGGLHTLALSSEGIVFSCGCNDEGALGRTTTSDNDYKLMRANLPKNVRIKKISAGDSHSAALSMDGKVYAWGAFRDTNGPIGLKTLHNIVTKPTLIYNIYDRCIDIVSGSNHLLLLTESGRMFSCGTGDEGQLGRIPQRLTLSRGGRRGSAHLTIPEEVNLVSFSKSRKLSPIIRISAGRFNSFAQLQDGSIYGWGLNDYKQLGDEYEERVFFPILLKNLMKTCLSKDDNPLNLYISGGIQHSIILNTTTNSVYSMGNPEDGRLGLSKYTDCTKISEDDNPIQKVDLPSDISQITQITCGDACSFLYTSDLQIYSWGVGCNNQLGFGNEKDVYIPTKIPSLSPLPKQIIQISSGGQHTAILCIV